MVGLVLQELANSWAFLQLRWAGASKGHDRRDFLVTVRNLSTCISFLAEYQRAVGLVQNRLMRSTANYTYACLTWSDSLPGSLLRGSLSCA